ncbi:hypothetical protein CLH39_11915 [Alcaligenes faecalis]|uniref:hypothetical protein n=1 Tax=Alcaligenes faecalis TaxID=511 RepID=UPI001931D662|nr:hypothetical protein [Alcaligenes faecalis]QRF90895.1 hypothetical protein CLH39_11915 [Alcaligenes faecalis]
MKKIRVTYKLPHKPEKTIDLPYGEGTLESLKLQIQIKINNKDVPFGTSVENWHHQHASVIEIIKQEIIS